MPNVGNSCFFYIDSVYAFYGAKMKNLSRTNAFELFVQAAIFMLVAIAYFGEPNTDFIGDDNYIAIGVFTGFSKLLSPWLYAGHGGFMDYLKEIAGSVVLSRYGPLPAAFFGFWFLVWDLLRLPFSLYYAQLPLVLFSALIPVFFFRVMRNMNIGVFAAAICAIILASSPLLIGAARGVVTYWSNAALVGHIVALWGLQRLVREPNRPLLPGLTLFNLILSDPLFFLTLPALLLAFCLRRVSPAELWHQPREILAEIRAGAAPLLSKALWIHIAVAVAFIFLSTLSVIVANLFHVTDTPLVSRFMAVAGHGELAIRRFDPVMLFRQASMTLGELTAVVFFAACIVLWLKRRQVVFTGLEGWFTLFCTAGFGLIFYIYLPGGNELLYYQFYIVFPLLLLFIVVFRTLGPFAFNAAMVLLMCSSTLGAAARIWSLPTTIDHDGLQPLFYEQHYPEQGTKALGLLIRDVLINNAETPLDVAVYAPNWSTSVMAYSGLARRSAYFRYKFGREIPAQIATAPRDLDRDRCDAPIAVTIVSQAAAPDAANDLQCIKNGKRALAALILIGLRNPSKRTSFQVDALNSEFDRRYPRMMDLFPPR